MPIKTPRTKAEKKAAVHQVMHEFKGGELHSGSKTGPKVKSRKQAVAIAMSEAHMSKKAPSVGKGESKGAVDRSSHHTGNPGFPGSKPLATSHIFKGGSTHAHGYGHSILQRSGATRFSGNPKAHRIGKR